MKLKSILIATLFCSSFATGVFAAGNHDHTAKHGGIVAEGKEFDAELVAKPDLITVHIGDHGKPLSTKGARGKITLLSGSEKTDAELTPAGDSRMEAKGKFNVNKGTKVVIVVTLEGKRSGTVRFEMK